MTRVLLFVDENGDPLPSSDYGQCDECLGWYRKVRLGEADGRHYCDWCYDSTGQDPGALQGIDPEN